MMSEFQYTPDDEQKIHGAGAIALICKPFQSHENGLPEWAKNAADAYSRDAADPERRVIVIMTSDRKTVGLPSIACLDFVGTTSDQIERYFRHWADPEAARQGKGIEVQGGHGNGGKCYMTQMFTEFAIFHTVRGHKASRYGVRAGSAQFGYVPDRESGRDYHIDSLTEELEKALQPLGVRVSALPAPAQSALSRAQGFSLVYGVGTKNYEREIPVHDLVEQIKDHPQMLTTLHYARVFILHNGKLMKDAAPLIPSEVDPIPGAQSRLVPVPAHLNDPVTGRPLSTTNDGTLPAGILDLRTSRTSMKWKKKSRHTINYKTSSGGFIGYKHMLEFPVASGYRDKIYGHITLDSLEPFMQNDRGALAPSPLVRAVDDFISAEIQRYAEEFEIKDRKEYTKKERNALSRMNEALDKWKNQFIQSFVTASFGEGGGRPGGGHLPSGKPVRIEVSVTHPRLGIGVAIRPQIRFFDASGRQIRPVPFRWVSEDSNVALVDDELMLINSFTTGDTVIFAETLENGLTSNRVPIQVIRIRSIDLVPDVVVLPAGSKFRLVGKCHLSSGEVAEDVALVWTEGNSSIARVSASGLVFGINPGSTEVTAGDDKVTSGTATVTVTEGRDEDERGKGKGGSGSGKNRGRGYPLILVSGEVDPDPETQDYVNFSSDDPPVMQRPQDADRNIWWINSAAPLAALYLDKDADFGYDSREWRIYHIERYIDIITQIAIEYDPSIDRPLTAQEFYLQIAGRSAELQAAIAEELREFIQSGATPE